MQRQITLHDSFYMMAYIVNDPRNILQMSTTDVNMSVNIEMSV